MFCTLPEQFCRVEDAFIALKIPFPTVRNCSGTPACPGKRSTAGTDSISISSQVDCQKKCILKSAGLHEAGQGCMRTEHSIQRGIFWILLVISQSRKHFSIRA